MGNILSISEEESRQITYLAAACIGLLALKWRDLALIFFDATYARSIGLPVTALNVFFFSLLSAAAVASLQVVGACLVIAMVVTPGSTAYLLTDRFGPLILISVAIGSLTSALGAYASYFLDVSPGGLIVVLQTILFLIAFFFAPKHGFFRSPKKTRLNRVAI
jgi:manganese/iron transport system permease protein